MVHYETTRPIAGFRTLIALLFLMIPAGDLLAQEGAAAEPVTGVEDAMSELGPMFATLAETDWQSLGRSIDEVVKLALDIEQELSGLEEVVESAELQRMLEEVERLSSAFSDLDALEGLDDLDFAYGGDEEPSRPGPVTEDTAPDASPRIERNIRVDVAPDGARIEEHVEVIEDNGFITTTTLLYRDGELIEQTTETVPSGRPVLLNE